MIVLLLKLLLAHVIGDFVLQPKKWVKQKNKKKHKKLVIIDAPPPKCDTKNCECFAAKNKYYPNSEGGEFWTLCEKCYKKDQEDEEEEVANCNDCETPLDHLRDGTTEEGYRCNNCYWEDQGGRDAAEAIITPDYRVIRVEFGEIDNTDQEEDEEEDEEIDAPPPKWHEKCSKCQDTKHDCDWIYCLQNRAYCGACSPSWGCDFLHCQACNR